MVSCVIRTGGEKMESLKSIKFNHAEENIPLAMGLSEGQKRLICDRVQSANEESGTITGTMEILIREFKGAQLLFAILDMGLSMGRQAPSAQDILSRLFGTEE